MATRPQSWYARVACFRIPMRAFHIYAISLCTRRCSSVTLGRSTALLCVLERHVIFVGDIVVVLVTFQGAQVQAAFAANRDLILMASQCKKPDQKTRVVRSAVA